MSGRPMAACTEKLRGLRAVRDVRGATAFGRTDRVTVTLDPIDPTILLLQP